MTRAISLPKSDMFCGEIKCWKYNSFFVVNWIFSVAVRISFVSRFGIRTIGSALFKCGNTIVSKVDVHEGVDDALFCRGVEGKYWTDVF